jgi:superfamily II DNA or RNA helicase
MTGAGKSFPALYALDSLKYDEETGKKAVVVHGKATRDQWHQYFEEFAPRLEDEVEVVTYQSMHNLDGEYNLIVFDEAHALPADTFAKGATIPTKYRSGLTASPYREDDRQNYVFALTGPPVGLDWEKTAELMEKTFHKINIHIVDDRSEKIDRIQSVLDEVGDSRTMIFSDSLEFGDEISEATGLEFVNGEDSKQLKKIQDNRQVIVSRIADHGVSIDDLEVVLEADFLFGSRRQQIQRTGRLFHGEGERHDIFFTRGEFNKYQKRLYSLIEKGFDLNFVDHEEEIEVPDKYQSRVDMDIESKGEKVEKGHETVERSSSVGEDEFLQHPKIKEEVKKAIQDYSRVKDETLKEVLIEIDLSKDGLSNQEISERLGNPITESARLTSGFRNHEPPILVQDDENRNQFNTELLDELKEVEERRKRRQKMKKQLDF